MYGSAARCYPRSELHLVLRASVPGTRRLLQPSPPEVLPLHAARQMGRAAEARKGIDMQFQWPMTRRHPFAWLAVAGLVLLVASIISACADLPPLEEVPLPMGEAYQSPEGLIVRPQAVGDEDWADILGIKRWRFDLQGVAPDTELRCGQRGRIHGRGCRESFSGLERLSDQPARGASERRCL